MRSVGISLLSVVLTTTVIANAYYQKKQFYPSVVYITKSNPSMAVMYIQAFIFVFLAGKLMRKIFFGQLRTAEFEHLMERAWYAITETCLAFTVFRDDFNPKFVALFTLLLFLKSFHWLAEDRVDYMERSPVISWLFHIRVISLLGFLGSFDFFFVQHAYLSTMTKGPSVQLVFGFEYAILLTMILNILIKYSLHTIDLNSEAPWENKAVYLLYTELVMGFIKVVLYVAFVVIMVRIYTLPLFAFRPMYYTTRNFKKAFNDVILSRRAIHNMNTLYPDASAEELGNADNVCIICREEMTTASKKLPCNHIFHTACLRSWFQRQQTCPTCRLNILRTTTTPNVQQQRQDQRQRAQPVPNPFVGPNPFVNFNPFQHLFNPNVQNPNQQMPPQDMNVPLINPLGPGQVPQPGQANTQQQPNLLPPPPFGLPPLMPFPFVPFISPPPLPPNYLRSLSLDELRRIEGEERHHVEARIECLKNIQIMLDAAVLMMQQYSASVNASASMQSTSQNASATVPPPPPSTSSATNNEPIVTNDAAEDTNLTSQPTNNLNSNSSCNITDSVPSNSSTEASSVQSHSDDNLSTTLSPEEEIRKRRLQRFQQAVE